MNNEELILSLVREIHDDQKDVVTSINELKIAQEQLKSEIAASRNGYEPHEIVTMLHWVEEQMKNAEKQKDNIRQSITSWLVPILGSSLVVGLILILSKYI